jgi:hypothetical protein
VLQIPDFNKEFVLVTDASDLSVSAVLHQQAGGELAPISYYSRLLTVAEQKYRTYEKKCLAVIFGCEKCRTYLEHKEFELHYDLALCWLLKRIKVVGRLSRWILRLAPFKFRVKHTRGVDNVVADALSSIFERNSGETPEMNCAALWQSLPSVYSSLGEHQNEDSYCADLRNKIQASPDEVDNFQICRDLLCFYPKQAKRRRWVVPVSLRPMLLKYFHDSVLSGHWAPVRLFRQSLRISGGLGCD